MSNKKNFGLIWHAVFKLFILSREVGYLFEFEWTQRKATIILGNFVNRLADWLFFGKCSHWSKFKARSRDIFFLWTFDFLLINCSRFILFEIWNHYIKEILYLNTYSKGSKWSNKNKEIYIFTCLRYWCWRIHVFLMQS